MIVSWPLAHWIHSGRINTFECVKAWMVGHAILDTDGLNVICFICGFTFNLSMTSNLSMFGLNWLFSVKCLEKMFVANWHCVKKN